MRLSKDAGHRLDTIEAAEVIMDAKALAKAFGAPLEEKDGRKAVRIDLSDGGQTFKFALPKKDLRAFDQIVITLRTEKTSVRPSLEIELESRTAGLVHNDSFRSGMGAVIRRPRWGSYPFPYENYLVYGMGDLVNPVKELKLHIAQPSGGAAWISELRAERRGRATGPRLTDKGLLEALTLEADTPAAVMAHFRKRKKPLHWYSKLPDPGDKWTPDGADRICEHFICGYQMDDPIDWRLNPNGYLEWMHAFNRHGWLGELLRACRATRQAKYARKLDEIWLSWLRDNPEPIGHNGGGDPAWETLSTAARVYGSWLTGWFGLLRNRSFRDSTRIEILKSFYGHAEHLMDHKGHTNNWLIVESRVLFVLGLVFPEFERAEAWLEEGRKRLEREIKRQIFPDGADWELAAGYHMMASTGFLNAYELAKLNGLSMPPLFEERLPKTFDYVAGMTRPDGTSAAVNDSGGYYKRSGTEANYLAYGARLFNRPELLESPEGTYAGQSRAFPDAGFHIMASGLDQQALWLMFDCGYPGASHQHRDGLNLEVFAHGLCFIVDPGITGYFNDLWTDYYRRTEAHNTVLVNGVGQVGPWRPHDPKSLSARGQAQCAFGEVADFVRCTYSDGYEGLPQDTTHTRAILFVRGRYWVVFDEVAGAAARKMEARFQFVPLRLTVDRRRGVFRTLRQSRPNLELIVASPQRGAKLSIATGETDPVGGWVAGGEDQPAPQARIALARGKKGCLRLATVICPFATGINSGVKIKERQDAADGETTLEIRHADGRVDTIRYAWEVNAAAPLSLTTPDYACQVRGKKWVEQS